MPKRRPKALGVRNRRREPEYPYEKRQPHEVQDASFLLPHLQMIPNFFDHIL